MTNSLENAVRMSPSHPEYKKVDYLLALLAAIINPEAHFNFNKISEKVKELPKPERSLEEERRQNFILATKRELQKIFDEIQATPPIWFECIRDFEMDDMNESADIELLNEIFDEAAENPDNYVN